MELITIILVVSFIVFTLQKKNQPVAKKRNSGQSALTVKASTSSYSARPKSSVSPDSVWIPQGKSVKVAGYTIPGGLLYVGSGLYNIQGWNIEPALINPSLPVDRSLSDREGAHMSYWPSYSEIHPTSRNAYLQWLAEGCYNPNINTGYVFLYFYGLERRALSDIKDLSQAEEEVDTILSEVKRLRTIYSNKSFSNYAARFINAVESKRTKNKLYKNLPSFDGREYGLPFTLKKALAQVAADGVPLSAEWALAWVDKDLEGKLRTPAYRCKDEFKKIFQMRYKEQFGEGFIFPKKGQKLVGNYHPASASFGGSIEWTEDGLVDVSTYRTPVNQFSRIAETCVEELEPYSRYIGRNETDVSLLSKYALLPAQLLKDCSDPEIQALRQWLEKEVKPNQMLTIGIQDVIRNLSFLKADTLGKRDFMALCQLLAKMGVGIEPDIRFGGSMPEFDPVVLFRTVIDPASCPTQEYVSATVILHLAATVASSDGRICDKEEKHLQEQLEARFQLSAEEKTRLSAHMLWLLKSSLNFSGVKKRLESFNKTQRETMGKFLVLVAQADGYIHPSEIKILNKIYGMLGFDPKELYSHAHMAVTEPVKIEDPEMLGSFALPKPPQKKKTSDIDLDMKKIEVKLAETAAVTAMLNNIFVKEEARPPVVEEVKVDGNFQYFEVEHHKFIKELSQKLTWTRGELEALAAKDDLLLDGVLDSINEAAFTAFDQPFFEGDDPVEMNPTVLKELHA